jgi:hypothetical protein
MKRLCLEIFLFSFTLIIFQIESNAQTQGNPAPLPNRTMLSLSGYEKNDKVELKGVLSASHSYDKLIIERAETIGTFEKTGEINISGTASTEFHFNYLDANPASGVNYYRIKLMNSITKVHEFTSTLMVKMDNDTESLEVINTVVQGSSPVLTVKCNEDDQATFQTVDMNGRLLKTEQFALNNGVNNIRLSGCNDSKGFFVIIVITKKKTISQRVLVQ